jgi:hypothetical protein
VTTNKSSSRRAAVDALLCNLFIKMGMMYFSEVIFNEFVLESYGSVAR